MFGRSDKGASRAGSSGGNTSEQQGSSASPSGIPSDIPNVNPSCTLNWDKMSAVINNSMLDAAKSSQTSDETYPKYSASFLNNLSKHVPKDFCWKKTILESIKVFESFNTAEAEKLCLEDFSTQSDTVVKETEQLIKAIVVKYDNLLPVEVIGKDNNVNSVIKIEDVNVEIYDYRMKVIDGLMAMLRLMREQARDTAGNNNGNFREQSTKFGECMEHLTSTGYWPDSEIPLRGVSKVNKRSILRDHLTSTMRAAYGQDFSVDWEKTCQDFSKQIADCACGSEDAEDIANFDSVIQQLLSTIATMSKEKKLFSGTSTTTGAFASQDANVHYQFVVYLWMKRCGLNIKQFFPFLKYLSSQLAYKVRGKTQIKEIIVKMPGSFVTDEQKRNLVMQMKDLGADEKFINPLWMTAPRLRRYLSSLCPVPGEMMLMRFTSDTVKKAIVMLYISECMDFNSNPRAPDKNHIYKSLLVLHRFIKGCEMAIIFQGKKSGNASQVTFEPASKRGGAGGGGFNEESI